MSLFSRIKEFLFPQKKEGKKVFVNKDGINKVIYESELKDYLSKGYTRGRTKNK